MSNPAAEECETVVAPTEEEVEAMTQRLLERIRDLPERLEALDRAGCVRAETLRREFTI